MSEMKLMHQIWETRSKRDLLCDISHKDLREHYDIVFSEIPWKNIVSYNFKMTFEYIYIYVLEPP